MTHVTYRLTIKNRDQLRNPTFGNRVLATFTFLLLIIYVISEKAICNPLSHPTWKCTTLTCEVPNFFYLTEGLHCTCIFRTCVFRTCVFHPCEMRCFVLAFSALAFSSTCVFSAPPRRVCESCQPMEQWRCTKRSTSGRSEQSYAGTCYGGVLVASRYFLSR